MAALLRSGKVLRLITGLARQSQTPSNATQINQNSRNQSDVSSQRTQEANFSFPSWSLQPLHAALPDLILASQDRQDDDDDGIFKLEHLDFESKILGEPSEPNDLAKNRNEDKKKPILLKKPFKSEVIGFNAIKEDEDATIDKSQVAQKAVVSSYLHKSKGASRTTRPKEEEKFPKEKLSSESEPIQVPNDQPQLPLPLQEIHVSEITTPERKAVETLVKVEEDSLAIAEPEISLPPSDEYFLPYSAVIPMVQVQENGISQVLPLHAACAMFRDQGRVTDLENLLVGSYGIRREDRKLVFMWTLQAYADQGMLNGAIMLNKRLEWEGLSQDFPEFHLLLGQLIQNTVLLYQPTLEISVSTFNSPYPTCPSTPVYLNTEDDGSYLQTLWYRKLKKGLLREQPGEVMKAFYELEKINKVASVNELSAVVELLVKKEHFCDAISVTEAMLERQTYPTPKIFRFLLNRLAATGQVELMNKLNLLMSIEARKEVSFDNRLCNAYLAAGLGREYLENMERELDDLDPENFEAELERVKDKFPRGGAMGILETDPSLVCSFTRVAEKFLNYGFVAPTNVLWTYHFISGNYDVAEALWNKHVKDCPQIMFQKVCQTARLTGNADLAWRLVGLLRNASVTRGARGIAYSCLIDVLALKGDYEEGCEALRQALADGIHVSDVNRTALKRLGDCCTQNGVIFTFEEPHRTNVFFGASSHADIMDDFSTAMVAMHPMR